MDQKDIQKCFIKHKKLMIKELGKKATDNIQLFNVGKKLFGKKFIGVFAQNTAILGKNGYSIINTSTDKEDGEHWVALYETNKTVYVFDSFGRDSKLLLPILTKNINKKKLHLVNSNLKNKEQVGYKSEVCGQLSLSWLSTVHELGIKNGIKI